MIESNPLARIAAERGGDPLAPVTVIVPSHIAALQMRRRLAAFGPFAAVRFETLPRLAELLAGSTLAARGRRPLARPIGDYLARQLALEARYPFEAVRDRPGFAPALRAAFRRLRHGGVTVPEAAIGLSDAGAEVLRLYGAFRAATASFYDEHDLLDAAAAVVRATGGAAVNRDLGVTYIAKRSRGGAAEVVCIAALRAALDVRDLGAESHAPEVLVALSPDADSESARVARDVVAALEAGRRMDAIAVLYAGANGHEAMLEEHLARAGVPFYSPGVPLSRTRAGRAALALLRVVDSDFARTAVFDFLHLVDGGASQHRGPASVTAWDRISREAGVTRGLGRWGESLAQFRAVQALRAQDPTADEVVVAAARRRAVDTETLGAAVEALAGRLAPLHSAQPAAGFIVAFRSVLADYLPPELEGGVEVDAEIEQLGTIGAVGGSFDFASFREAIRANLDLARLRVNRLDAGVLVADFRTAAGLVFDDVVICGAVEDAIPARPPLSPLLPDADLRALRARFPQLEDLAASREAAGEAAETAMNTARSQLMLSAFQYESGGRRPKHASHMLVAAAHRHDAAVSSASTLRAHPVGGWLRREVSPLGSALAGPPLDAAELGLRAAVAHEPDPALARALELRRARRSDRLTAWDGLVGGGIVAPASFSSTTLEKYAACGFRYFGEAVLRLNAIEEPEELDTMDARSRGSLFHDVLEQFVREQQARGRPARFERWDIDDERDLLAILDDAMRRLATEGRGGLDVFLARERQSIAADLRRFLVADSEFRAETGAVPWGFEVPLPESEVAGVRLRGRVDRIDLAPDQSEAWVIDYKTGSTSKYGTLKDGTDPLAGGTLLQLAAYASAANAPTVNALYWFITRKARFERLPGTRVEPPRDAFERTVSAILGGIKRGVFPAVPGAENEYYSSFENCSFCLLDRICPTRRLEAFDEKAGDPAMAPWTAVAAAARGGADG